MSTVCFRRTGRCLCHWVACAALLVLAWPTLLTADPTPIPKWIEPTDEVLSPHIAWRNPAHGGPLRVLFITYRTGMREIIEVSQRFDIARDVFAIERSHRFAGGKGVEGGKYQHEEVFTGTLPHEQEARLREKLDRDYDVIVIGDIQWDVLPDWARKNILDKVSRGTGLVGYIPRGVDEALQRAVDSSIDLPPEAIGAYPFSMLPAFGQHVSLDAFIQSTMDHAQHGQGRIVLLKGFSTAPPRQVLTPAVAGVFPDQYLIHYDYYLALLGHLMWYAAEQPQEVYLLQPEKNVLVVDRSSTDQIQVGIDAQNAVDVTLDFVLRDTQHGTIVARNQQEVSLIAGENHVSIPVRDIPAGSYFGDVWVKRKGQVVTFGSLALKVTSSSHITQIQLDSIDFGQESLIGWGKGNSRIARHERYQPADGIMNFRPADLIRGTVSVAQPKQGQHLEITQWDRFGRIVARSVVELTADQPGAEVAFELEPPSPLSVAQHLEINLVDGDQIVDRQRQRFFYRELFPTRDDIYCWMWQGYGGDSYLNRLLARVIREAGFDAWMNQPLDVNYQFVGAGILEGLSMYPLVYDDPVRSRPLVEWKGNVSPGIIHTKQGDIRQPCLTDPQFHDLCRRVYAQAGQTWSKFSIGDYDLGSESTLADYGMNDVCFSETCTANFRKFIQDEYQTLDHVNAEYGMSYNSWDQIAPITYRQARKKGPIPLWIDTRIHMDTVYANYYADAKEAIEQVVPGARVGHTASNDPGHAPPVFGLGGSDYWKLAQAMNLNATYYYPMQLECVRDFSPPGTLIGGGAYGGYRQMWRASREPLHHRWWIWNGVLKGATVLYVWQGSSGSGELLGTTIAPDFTFYDFMQGTVEEIQRLKQGAAKLLCNADRADDGVAVLVSRPSMLLSNFTKGFPEGWHIPGSTPLILTEAGFQFRMISPQQLEKGVLTHDGFRLLYLPYCQALSPAEVSQILAFARSGGTVVADLRPAVADEHGKPHPSGALDELFGVMQNTQQAMAREGLMTLADDVGQLDDLVDGIRVDASLQLDSGTALGTVRSIHEEMVQETPVLVIHDYGNGHGVLLNMNLAENLTDRLNSNIRFADEEKAGFVKDLIQTAFAVGNVRPAVPLAPYLPGCHVYRFESGEAQILGLLWDAPGFLPGAGTLDVHHPQTGKRDRELLARVLAEPQEVVMKLPQRYHLYDILNGTYLGHVKEVPQRLHQGGVQLLCALPYEVESVTVVTNPSPVPQGADLTFSATIDVAGADVQPGLHILRIELVDPDGQMVEHYLRKVRAESGVYEDSISLSLNEREGEWRLHVTDVSTGIEGDAPFTVHSKPLD